MLCSWFKEFDGVNTQASTSIDIKVFYSNFTWVYLCIILSYHAIQMSCQSNKLSVILLHTF